MKSAAADFLAQLSKFAFQASGWAHAFNELLEIFLIFEDLKFNFGHNILEIYKTLEKLLFVTGKAVFNIQHKKHST